MSRPSPSVPINTVFLTRWPSSLRKVISSPGALLRPAGLMAVEGFRAAGDPNRYPEQIAEGLRPWQPKKVYIGGVRENENWSVRIDSGVYDSRLGDSYDNVARYGLSFHPLRNSA